MKEQLELQIRKSYWELRKSEKKVADFLLNYQADFRELNLERIAQNAKVSQPTVLRFIKALGYRGYKEFRYLLCEDDTMKCSNRILYGFGITEKDQVRDVPSKIIGTSMEQLQDTLCHITAEKLETAVAMINQANQIAVYYVENSSCTASDLVTKLMYLGKNCYSYSDSYMQSVSASNLKEGDLAIGISYSGSSKSTVDALRAARKAGAAAIAITNFEGSLLGEHADLILATSSRQLIYGDAIFSRVSQLAVVDMLYTGVLLSDYSHYTRILDRSSEMIKGQAYVEILQKV